MQVKTGFDETNRNETKFHAGVFDSAFTLVLSVRHQERSREGVSLEFIRPVPVHRYCLAMVLAGEHELRIEVTCNDMFVLVGKDEAFSSAKQNPL